MARLTLLLTLLLSFQALGNGRGPAVEDFVGIEVEHEVGAFNEHSLVNLEKDIKDIQKANSPKIQAVAPTKNYDYGTIFGIGFILTLPLLSWIFVIQHLKQKAKLDSASNVEVLANYRKAREQKINKEEKKAS